MVNRKIKRERSLLLKTKEEKKTKKNNFFLLLYNFEKGRNVDFSSDNHLLLEKKHTYIKDKKVYVKKHNRSPQIIFVLFCFLVQAEKEINHFFLFMCIIKILKEQNGGIIHCM